MKDIYCEMGEYEKKLFDKSSDILMTKFETKDNFISVEELWDIIDELLYDLEQNKEELKKWERGYYDEEF
jgi:hypothetical protein